MLLLAKRRFLDLLGRTKETSIFGAHLVDLAKATSTDLLQNDVVVEVVVLLHLDETVPFHFDLLELLPFFLPLALLHQQVLLLVHLYGHLRRDAALLLLVDVIPLVH